MKMTGWAAHQERAFFHASDYCYFATEFHRKMFLRNLNIIDSFHHKAITSGQPHTYLIPQLEARNKEKTDTVLFPHRLNSDKQPEIFDDLSTSPLSRFNGVVNQRMGLSKDEYYTLLGTVKAVFSCSLHENLGISMMEGVFAGAIPIVPDRASYSEMYLKCFKYPTEWTESFTAYQNNKERLIAFVNNAVVNSSTFGESMERQKQILRERFMSPTVMVEKILS
jgi:hypothetical protein